jgi:hypothetical protein
LVLARSYVGSEFDSPVFVGVEWVHAYRV